jgi:GT2 family glycosyltransferase
VVVKADFGPSGPKTTVIVATYNQQRWLELVLAGLAAQTDPDFDVIVADDGSKPPASEVVDRLSSELPFPARVLWQEDEGFRKARLQNTAVGRTDSELLIFLDGDCIPFRNLVEIYRRYARSNEFMVGGVSYLSREITERITPEGVRAGEHERSVSGRETLRIWSVHLKNLWHLGRKQTRPRLKGGNFAVGVELFRRVDGFDEVYLGYGKEDSDLRNRMRNAGARGQSLWPRARACHLFWPRPFGAGRVGPGPELYEEGRHLVRARIGLSTHLAGEET